MKIKILGLVFLLLVGCGGFQTTKFDKNSWEAIGNPANGIIYYEPQLVKITYHFTELVDKNNNVIGSSKESTCQRTIDREELTILPNYSEPRLLVYKPPFLSSGQFGVTLHNGMLTSVNSQTSSPASDAVKSAMKSAGKEAAKGLSLMASPNFKPACNSSSIITSITKAEKFSE